MLRDAVQIARAQRPPPDTALPWDAAQPGEERGKSEGCNQRQHVEDYFANLRNRSEATSFLSPEL